MQPTGLSTSVGTDSEYQPGSGKRLHYPSSATFKMGEPGTQLGAGWIVQLVEDGKGLLPGVACGRMVSCRVVGVADPG